jgi:uncharacterized protein
MRLSGIKYLFFEWLQWRTWAALLFICLVPLLCPFFDALIAESADLKEIALVGGPDLAEKTLSGDSLAVFLAEVVSESPETQKGLGGRDSMPDSSAMLFILDPQADHAFWMIGMRFGLDIIFFDGERRVTQVIENLQPCSQCRLYFPENPVSYALEVNAGLAARYGIKKGDTLVFKSR